VRETDMKVILKEDVKHLGKRGTVVDVSEGYGRNYLLPKKVAVKITPGNLKQIDREKRIIEIKMIKEKQEAEKLAARIGEVSCTIVRKVGENDALYGSVTSGDVQTVLKEEGFEIDKKKIVLDEPIKTLGIYKIPIKIHRDVTATMKLWVVKE
jgi:large subunit ribosomal protein L9